MSFLEFLKDSPAVLGNTLGVLGNLFSPRGSKHGKGGAATKADAPNIGALVSGENYGPLLDKPLTNTSGSIPSAIQASLSPTTEEYHTMLLPEFANPKELVQNAFFDDALQQSEFIVPLTSSGGNNTLIAGTEIVWNLTTQENPVRLRGMRMLLSYSHTVEQSKYVNARMLEIHSQQMIWELFSQMQILVNNITIMTYTAQNAGGLKVFALMDSLFDPLRLRAGNTSDGIWLRDLTAGPFKDIGMFSALEQHFYALPVFTPGSAAFNSVTFVNRMVMVEMPFSFFLNSHHVGRLTSIRISFIVNPAMTTALTLRNYSLYNFLSEDGTKLFSEYDKLIIDAQTFTNFKMLGMFADLVPLSAPTRQEINRPFTNRILKHEILMLDWDPLYLPSGAGWPSPTYVKATVPWYSNLWSGQFIVTQGIIPQRPFAMMEVAVQTGAATTGPWTETTNIFLPGAITHQCQVRNGTQYDYLQSNELALASMGTPATESENQANYIFYMNRRREYDYSNTNTSVNLPNAFQKMQERTRLFINSLSSTYVSLESGPKVTTFLAELANCWPDMIKPDNVPNNINGLVAPHHGQLEGRYFLAPLQNMQIAGFLSTDAATATYLQFQYKACWIFRERLHIASYGPNLETQYVDVQSMLTSVDTRY